MTDRKVCEVDGCESTVLCKGLCSVHYERKRRTGSTEKRPRMADRMCVECDVRYALYADGRCQPCWRRARLGAQHIRGTCRHCGKEFESSRRYANDSGRIKYCSAKCKQAERKANGKASEAALRNYYKREYGITPEQAAELRAQGCAICGATIGGGRHGQLHIDHDHKTGQRRGALCDNCNLGLGKFQDDPALLEAAAAYLRSYAEVEVAARS